MKDEAGGSSSSRMMMMKHARMRERGKEMEKVVKFNKTSRKEETFHRNISSIELRMLLRMHMRASDVK
jgi:hypothetical protein